MDQNQSPIYMKGHRNIFCPYYSDCLNHAAKHYWAYWACFNCQHKDKKNLVTEVLLSPESDYPYYTLSPSINEKVENF